MRHVQASLVAVFLTLTSVGCTTATHHVDSAAAHVLVEHGATLLDVRTEGEWSGGHLPGAVLIPVQQLATRMGELPRDHAVVVYCQSGARSAQAADMLASAGYDVHDLGGLGRW